MKVPSPTTSGEKRYRGLGLAEGIARGPAVVHWDVEEDIPERSITAEDLPGEIARFEAALIATRAELLEIQEKIARSLGSHDAGIFDAHLLVIEDRTLIEEVLRLLQKELKNVEYVFHTVAERYARSLEAIDDPYLSERVVDIHDVSRRVIRHLLGRGPVEFTTFGEPHILVARVLAPSDTALLDPSKVRGLVTEAGGKTSHAAILARSLGIPAVSGIHGLAGIVETGDDLLVDGSGGLLIVRPSEATLEEFRQLEARRGRVEEELAKLRPTPSATADGRRIVLSANIESAAEVDAAVEQGAEGVGLFRTEYLFLNRAEPPSEDEQFENYRLAAERARPHSIIIRTLDLGGDKMPKSLEMPEEENPFLGCRAIRFCLEHPEIFKPQLRAILRAAAATGNIKMMYPMISGLGELRRAAAVLEECREELRREGLPQPEQLEVGIMIEVPSAALSAPLLARECAFFSIGTNDLIQYTLAADRVNDRLAHLFEPTHPAVLRLIAMVVEAARGARIWTGVCGEMAGDVALTPLLLGLGIEELSVAPRLVPRVKRAIQSLSMPVCEALAAEALTLDSPAAIQARCEEVAMACYGELFA